MVIPTDVLLQATYEAAPVDDLRAAATVCSVFLFLALLTALETDRFPSWVADLALLLCAAFAFLLWWPLVQNAALPAHFA